MKKTEYTDNPSRDLRRKVADGKGFFNICMSAMKEESEAACQIDELGEALSLLGKRPRRENEVSLPGSNGQRLEQLIVRHRRSHMDYPQQEGFLYIMRRLPGQLMPPPERLARIPENSQASTTANQQKFYAFNELVARGLSPKEAEKQVERMYSPVKKHLPMSNPHKPWARIDSRLQRQLGHYAYYGMPADTPRTAIHTLIGTPSYTVPEIDYGIRHIPANDPFFSAFPNHLRGIPRQDEMGIWSSPDIELLAAQNVQVPRNTVPVYETAQPVETTDLQPITSFKDGFVQSNNRWLNNLKYLHGQIMRKRNHEDDIRNGLRHLDQNPELDRNNIQQINSSIRALRKDIAERRKRIESQIGTEEDEQAILRNSDMIRALYAMQKQYYKGATAEEAEDWRNEYIAKGSTGTQTIHDAIEREKSFRPTKGMGTFGEIIGNVITEAPLIAGTAIGAAPIGVVAGTASLANAAFNNLAQSNMQADILEEETGQEISTARRLGQAALGTGTDMIASKVLPGRSSGPLPFLKHIGQETLSQGAWNGVSSAIKDIGQNEILGDDLSAGEILANAGRNAVVGGLTGGAISGAGHMMNRGQKGSTYSLPKYDEQSAPLYYTDVPLLRNFLPRKKVRRSTLGPMAHNAIDLEKSGINIGKDLDYRTAIAYEKYLQSPDLPPGTYISNIPFSKDIDPNSRTVIEHGTHYRESPDLPPGTYMLNVSLPDGIDPNSQTPIQNRTYTWERSELPPATYKAQIPFPEDIDPNSRTVIEHGTHYRERPELPPIERNAIDMDNLEEGLKANSHPQIPEEDDIVIRTPFGIYESMFGIDKLKEIGDPDQKTKIPFKRHKSRLWKKKKK